MSAAESESEYKAKLEVALRQAGEWKAKAFKTQKAAEHLKQTAEALRDRAQTAVESNRELSVALRMARLAAAENEEKAKELDEVKNRLEQSERRREAALGQLSAVEQQLALYQLAVKELRDGADTEQIVTAIRRSGEDPEVEQRLADELEQCRHELQACRDELAESRAEQSKAEKRAADVKEDMKANRVILETKIAKLEQQNLDHRERTEKQSQFVEQLISDRAFKERRIEAELRETRLRLKVKLKALQDAQDRLATIEGDTQTLIEELYTESENMRTELGILAAEKLEREQELEAQITLLEDERSDLEIVNADLYQKIAALEG